MSASLEKTFLRGVTHAAKAARVVTHVTRWRMRSG